MSDETIYRQASSGGLVGIMPGTPGYEDATKGVFQRKDFIGLGAQIAQEPRQESILDHLKAQREKIKLARDAAMRNAFTWQSHADIDAQRLRDVDIAIAALEPAPADEPQPIPDEPELFDDEPREYISELTGDPCVEPESGLHGEPVEGYAPVTNPEADFWARGLTEQPKPERKLNPFSIFRREPEDAL
jgi:hypothetical protein